MKVFRSRYTLAEHWPDGRGLLLNAFSGAVDIVSSELVGFVQKSAAAEINESDTSYSTFVGRGYYIDSLEAEHEVAQYLMAHAKARVLEYGQPKYMFSLSLQCNLTCNYCWQVQEHGESRQRTALMSTEMVDAAFAYIQTDLAGRKRKDAFISLFGGEPLLDTPVHRSLINSIGERALSGAMHLHFTTNGTTLAFYRDEIKRFRPSIQVTIDGASLTSSGVVLRRASQDIDGVYGELADIASEGFAEVILRFLVTEQTACQFADLADQVFRDARFAKNFTLAVAPIQNKSEFIDPNIPPKFRVLRVLMNLLKGKDYAHRIAYTDWRSLNLFSNLRRGVDTLPDPVFFHCEANTDLTCFDHEGRVYACYESIGNAEQSIGTYWPTSRIDEALATQFRERSAFSMIECSECALSPVCGGGCEVRAFKKRGQYFHHYCDSLHSETRLTMRHWGELSRLLIGNFHEG